MLEMTAESGTLEGETQTGRLQRAKGILFRDDIPRARFTAPEVDADQTLRRVTARGGVTVTSIDPPGMVLKADVVTWYAKVNRVTATGNVTFVHTPNGETQVRATGGPFEKVVYDVETQAVTIPPRGGE
jgi:lipopolysaccharide assembly outer membrane protein LptD (OstA)